MQLQGLEVINLGIGSPDLPPPPDVLQELQISAQKPDAHGYQSYRGLPELSQAISRFYKNTFGVRLNPETEILPLIGSKEGIFHISMAFLNPGDTVLVPNPGYPAYTAVSNMLQAQIEYYDLREETHWRIDFDQLLQKDLQRVKILWTNYLHMPTGTDANSEEFDKLIALAHKYRFLIVNDNPYSLILNDNPKSILETQGALEVALELNSLSKSHNMAGWRIGWLTGKQEYIDTVLQVKSNMDSGMFKALQKAAITALDAPLTWYQELNQVYEQRRKIAENLIQSLGCTFDNHQKGLFLWAKIPDDVQDVGDFCDRILNQYHVFITPGFIFGSQGNRYLRVSLCSPVEIFEKALSRILQKPVLS